MPNLSDSVAAHHQHIQKNVRAYDEGVRYRMSGTAALRPITGNPEDGVGSEAETAWDKGWNDADTGISSIEGSSAYSKAPAQDVTPAAFAITDLTDVVVDTLQTSESVIPSGFNATVLAALTGDATGKFSINGGAYSASDQEFSPGDSFTIQHTSSGSAATKVTSTLTIGGVASNFETTTAA